MQSRAGFVVLSLAASLLLPSATVAQEIGVGGKGPRVRAHDGRLHSLSGRPVFVVVDDLADFGHLRTATAPPLRIEVKGDVEIVPLEDGGVRITFVDE